MDAEIDLRAVFSFLRRQFWLVLAIFLAIIGLAGLYLLTLTPIYTATTLVMVDPSSRNLLLDQPQTGASSAIDARVEGEVLLAKSDNVLLAVIDRENLGANSEFQAGPGFADRLLSFLGLRAPLSSTPDDALRQILAKLDSRISVQRHRATFLISISASSEDPDLAARLANAMASAYIGSQLSAKVQGALAARDVVIRQLDAARQSLMENDGFSQRPVEEAPETPTELYDMRQRGDLARRQYEQLLALSQQLQAEASLQLADSRVVSAALRPDLPSFPNARNMLALAALIGLVLGIFLAFLYEHFIGGVTSDDQLAAIARTRSALVVPRVKLLPDQHSVAEALIAAPLSAYAEAVRRVRTSIDHSLAMASKSEPDRAPIIMVTSAAFAEGRTTLALSIARSYALAGRAALLIDCDFRRPSIHRQLGVGASDGLFNALRSGEMLDNFRTAATEDKQTGLLTLIGSQSSDVATDQLVTSRNFERLLAAAASAFEIVVLDTPPLGHVVDGSYIARQADAVVMVVQWATTPQQDVRKALLSLEPALRGSVPLIPVLNQQKL
ncbi:Wzz/FepE/Etk N-terminal domain-containing protein [Devosia sp. YIM 151766]|uniref:polysaccharide biosynthesis tyrosine autokinase n=1 Tax=Devosia sp. YIM 151766 TaxID=3017325 RepID=UPI00255CCA19|nr:polysaccharide biosynthesis tyrosine autokinase [Devosia sp. YIM 151766]WIY51567.1 Wzz/FepE/Etk N-terminal domain-containing protein [Devosia sp. YIM 151766]